MMTRLTRDVAAARERLVLSVQRLNDEHDRLWTDLRARADERLRNLDQDDADPDVDTVAPQFREAAEKVDDGELTWDSIIAGTTDDPVAIVARERVTARLEVLRDMKTHQAEGVPARQAFEAAYRTQLSRAQAKDQRHEG